MNLRALVEKAPDADLQEMNGFAALRRLAADKSVASAVNAGTIVSTTASRWAAVIRLHRRRFHAAGTME